MWAHAVTGRGICVAAQVQLAWRNGSGAGTACGGADGSVLYGVGAMRDQILPFGGSEGQFTPAVWAGDRLRANQLCSVQGL